MLLGLHADLGTPLFILVPVCGAVQYLSSSSESAEPVNPNSFCLVV